MKKKLLNVFAIALITTSMNSVAFAKDETMGEKVSEAASDTGKNVKKGVRTAKDKTCEMMNGKMECAAKKVKHKAQNVVGEGKDKVEDIKQ